MKKFLKLLSFIDSFLLISFNKIFPNRTDTINKIAIVKIDAIGDFFLWTHSAVEFRKKFPKENFKITLIGNSVWIPLAKAIFDFDEYIEIDRSKLSTNRVYRKNIFKKLSQKKYLSVFHPTLSREWWADILVHATRSNLKVGFIGENSNIKRLTKSFSNDFYSRLIPCNYKNQMELDNYSDFIRETINSEYKKEIINLNSKFSDSKYVEKNYCVIFPGCSWIGKTWSTNNFVELIKKIHQKEKTTFIICGGPGEEFLGETIVAALENIDVYNTIAKTNLLETASIIKNAKYLISNDTMAIHMAEAFSVKSFCILGGGHFGRFLPYSKELNPLGICIYNEGGCFNCLWNCNHPDYKKEQVPCIDEIDVDAVYKCFLSNY